MSVSLVIIADDLTGALDSVEPFASAGLAVAAAISIDGVPGALASGAEVLAINTGTRAASTDQARQSVEAAWNSVARHEPTAVFKKIDSRMKGRVAAEIDALAQASGRTRAIVCPAAPDIGRFVKDGRVIGHGVERPIVIVERLVDLDLSVTIADSADDEALLAPAARVRAAPDQVMAVGARGFAQALARTYSTTDRPHAPVAPAGPILMVIGSQDPITEAQVAHLCASRLDCAVISPEHAERASAAELTVLRASRDVCGRSAEVVAAELGAAAAAIVRRTGVRTLLCSGGDTLAAVARALGIDWLTPLGAVVPGAPLSHAEGDDGRFTLISKSGGFGDPDALVRIAAETRLGAMGAHA